MDNEINSPYDLFIHDLQSIFYLERRLMEELERIAGEVTNDELKEVLLDHQEQTSEQVDRLERVFHLIGDEPREHEARDFKGIFRESDQLNERINEVDLINIAYLNTAKKVEHIEISSYNSLLEMADRFDLDKNVVDLLNKNLEEEKEAAEKLQDLTEKSWWNKLIDRLM